MRHYFIATILTATFITNTLCMDMRLEGQKEVKANISRVDAQTAYDQGNAQSAAQQMLQVIQQLGEGANLTDYRYLVKYTKKALEQKKASPEDLCKAINDLFLKHSTSLQSVDISSCLRHLTALKFYKEAAHWFSTLPKKTSYVIQGEDQFYAMRAFRVAGNADQAKSLCEGIMSASMDELNSIQHQFLTCEFLWQRDYDKTLHHLLLAHKGCGRSVIDYKGFGDPNDSDDFVAETETDGDEGLNWGNTPKRAKVMMTRLRRLHPGDVEGLLKLKEVVHRDYLKLPLDTHAMLLHLDRLRDHYNSSLPIGTAETRQLDLLWLLDVDCLFDACFTKLVSDLDPDTLHPLNIIIKKHYDITHRRVLNSRQIREMASHRYQMFIQARDKNKTVRAGSYKDDARKLFNLAAKEAMKYEEYYRQPSPDECVDLIDG